MRNDTTVKSIFDNMKALKIIDSRQINECKNAVNNAIDEICESYSSTNDPEYNKNRHAIKELFSDRELVLNGGLGDNAQYKELIEKRVISRTKAEKCVSKIKNTVINVLKDYFLSLETLPSDFKQTVTNALKDINEENRSDILRFAFDVKLIENNRMEMYEAIKDLGAFEHNSQKRWVAKKMMDVMRRTPIDCTQQIKQLFAEGLTVEDDKGRSLLFDILTLMVNDYTVHWVTDFENSWPNQKRVLNIFTDPAISVDFGFKNKEGQGLLLALLTTSADHSAAACWRGSKEIMGWLIENGTKAKKPLDINEQCKDKNYEGQTAYHILDDVQKKLRSESEEGYHTDEHILKEKMENVSFLKDAVLAVDSLDLDIVDSNGRPAYGDVEDSDDFGKLKSLTLHSQELSEKVFDDKGLKDPKNFELLVVLAYMDSRFLKKLRGLVENASFSVQQEPPPEPRKASSWFGKHLVEICEKVRNVINEKF